MYAIQPVKHVMVLLIATVSLVSVEQILQPMASAPAALKVASAVILESVLDVPQLTCFMAVDV